MDSDEKTSKARERGGELGRMAGKFVKNAGPNAKRLVDENKPRVEKAAQDMRPKVEKAVRVYRPKVEQAGRDAAQYAQDHQDELKAMALKSARMRLGPLGMAIDALGLEGQPAQPRAGQCPQCSHVNASAARFCNECGARLDVAAGDNPKQQK